MKTIHRITTGPGLLSPLLTFVAYDRRAMKTPTFTTPDVDAIVRGIESLADYMPAHPWYWHVATLRGRPKWIRLRRVCLVSKVCVVPTYDGPRPLMLWADAFDLWQSHVRML